MQLYIGESIPIVKELKYNTFGVIFKYNEVTGLGLYKSTL